MNANATPRKRVEVAAGVLLRADGAFLLGQRAKAGIYGDYWEFPGGKVESGETPVQALVRELHEELAITVEPAQITPWLVREHVYEHAHVRLHFHFVHAWQGEMLTQVHAALAWQQPGGSQVGPMLPANAPVLKALDLPHAMAITAVQHLGRDVQLAQLRVALANGLRLLQVRETAWMPEQLRMFVQELRALPHGKQALLMVNSLASARAVEGLVEGCHLPARELLSLEERPPGFAWVGASCHTRAELERAAMLGLDYALLGHVAESRSHPEQRPLGWEAFAALVRDLPLPVFALGGVMATDFGRALQYGAHGIAAIDGAWTQPSAFGSRSLLGGVSASATR